MIKVTKNRKIIEYAFFLFGAVICVSILMTTKWINTLGGDNASQTYAIFTQIATSLHNGEIPFWNPYVWGGIPQMGSPINEAFYPINWVLCMICWNTSKAMVSYSIIPINISIHALIYYVGLCLILDKIMKLNKIEVSIIATLAVLSYSFTNFMTWNVYFDGFSWFSFLIFFTYKMLEEDKKRWKIFLGIIFGIEALLSVSVALIISVCFIFLLVLLHAKKNKTVLINFIKLLEAGIIGIIIGLPSIIATAIYIFNSTRFVPDIGYLNSTEKIPVEAFNIYKCEFSDVVSMLKISPNASFISTSIVLTLFAIIGMFYKTRSPFFVWIKIGFIFSFLYSIGFIAPDIIYYIPLINNLREPFMYGCFLNFFLTMLACIGYKEYKQEITSKNFPIYTTAYGIIIVIGIYNLTPHINDILIDNVCAVLIIMIVTINLIKISPAHTKKTICICMISVLVLLSIVLYIEKMNMGNYTETEAINKINNVNELNKEEIAKISELQQYDYTIAWGSNVMTLPQNGGAVIGLREAIGYYNPLPQNNVQIHSKLDLFKRCQIQGIKYIFINSENEKEFLDWFTAAYPMFRLNNTLNIYSDFGSEKTSEVMAYEYEDAVPGWAVTQIVNDSGTEQNYQWMNDSNTDLYKQAIIKGDKVTDEQLNAKNCNVQVNNVKNNSITFNTTSDGNFLLMTSQIYYPGWTAYVNGKRKEILVADETNCSLILNKGNNEVKLVYRPIFIIYAVYIQLFIMMLIILSKLVKRKI